MDACPSIECVTCGVKITLGASHKCDPAVLKQLRLKKRRKLAAIKRERAVEERERERREREPDFGTRLACGFAMLDDDRSLGTLGSLEDE